MPGTARGQEKTGGGRQAGTRYQGIEELIFSPPDFSEEIAIRSSLIPSAYDLSTIAVVAEMPGNKIELWIEAITYEDVRERLLD